MTATYGELLARHNIPIPPHLNVQEQPPILTGPQRQGDLLVVPTAADSWTLTGDPVDAGVQVVHGQATGNTHWLHGDPGVTWARRGAGQVVGILDVPADTTAYLVHTDEHGASGIGPGRYEIRRKREQADEIRLVQD